MFFGSACHVKIDQGVLTICDPDWNEVGKIVFISTESAERFASAARNCASAMADHDAELFSGFVAQFGDVA